MAYGMWMFVGLFDVVYYVVLGPWPTVEPLHSLMQLGICYLVLIPGVEIRKYKICFKMGYGDVWWFWVFQWTPLG